MLRATQRAVTDRRHPTSNPTKSKNVETAMNTPTQRGSSIENGKPQEQRMKTGAEAGKVVQGVKDQAAKLGEEAKELVSQAGDKLLDSAEEQKAAGANFLTGMA